MANKLYPPIIENALPAFYGNSITISYTLNRGVGYSEILGFSLIVKSTVTNEIIRQRKTYSKGNGTVTFSIKEIDDEYPLLAGGFYKIQLAFLSGQGGTDEMVGHYSTVGIAKYIGQTPPTLTIENNLSSVGCFVGIYDPKVDITEKMYSYQFSLYNSNGALIETSGEKLHNSASDIGLKQTDSWTPIYGMDNGSSYRVVFSVTTMNNLKLSKTVTIAANKDEKGYVPSNLQLIANYSRENGYVNLLIKSTMPNDLRNLVYGKFQIFKTSSKDNFQSKQRIAYFSLQNQDLFEKAFKDFTVESGYKYKYILQQINDYGIYSEEIYSNEVEAFYEHMYLFDGVRQLKIKFNPKVSTFKNTVFETKTDTIGSKYPFILRNPTVKYKEFNLSGLISYHMDEENFFLTDHEIWDGLRENEIVDNTEKTHNLTDKSISAEKVFKNYVLDWLNNGEIKMLKTATEGVFLVRLMNVSLSPNDTVGRMLHTFTATAYEVQDFTSELFSQAITIDRAKKYIGYKTIPLYNFPKKVIVEKTGDGRWGIVYNNNAYEIINNTALEYVTGARFEDIKPGTRFHIILERNNDVINFNLEIGATGTHRIDSALGYHIRSIKLEAPQWSTGDYTADIINNKGQITYEYERQAAHNNFNDITKIYSDIVVGRMWSPTWYVANIEEPLVTIDNKFLYRYQVIDNSVEGYVQAGYFYTVEDNKKVMQYSKIFNTVFLIYQVDYITEIDDNNNIRYFLKDTAPKIEIFPYEEFGCTYEPGQAIIEYEESKKLMDTYESGKAITADRFKWQPQTFNFSSYLNNLLENKAGLLIPIYPQKQNFQYNFLQTETATDIPTHYLELALSSRLLPYQNSNQNSNFETSEFYKTLTLPNSDASTNDFITTVFIPRYNSQGNTISKIAQETTIRNPFYVRLHSWKDNSLITESIVEKHKVEKMYTKQFFDNVNKKQKVSYAQDIIYKNFASNIYYNDTNVNGEYYMKEDIMNLYKIDFELIQVFYNEDLLKTQKNFKIDNAFVQHENKMDDGFYQNTERILSNYVEINPATNKMFGDPNTTERMYTTIQPGRQYKQFSNGTSEQTMIVEQVLKTEKHYYPLSSYSAYKEFLSTLFNFKKYKFDDQILTSASFGKISMENFSNLLKNFPGDLYYKEKISDDIFFQSEGYWYNKLSVNDNIPTSIKDANGDIILEKVYVNAFVQAVKNYTLDITPEDNEIIVVFKTKTLYETEDNGDIKNPHSFFGESYPQRIDLTDRFSYTLETSNYEQGLNNILGIYLGKNVRAFATYKRKAYDYHALVGDGVYKDLIYN